jgi:hypothetical protein
MISKFTKTVTSRFPGFPVENEPEANDMTDRLEDVNQLFLAHVVGYMSNTDHFTHNGMVTSRVESESM